MRASKRVVSVLDKEASIYVAGHRGLVGSALVRRLSAEGYSNLILRSRQELDLRDGSSVSEFFAAERPDYVFLAAARVGGIMANSTLPADFIYDNLLIQTNVIHSAHRFEVKKLLFLGSSCIYPRLAPQPIREDYLLSGPLEPTNDAYAIAKIAGIKMCQAYNQQHGAGFISAMPTNAYGPNDNFDPNTSHVLPALIAKFHAAKESAAPTVQLWGTGTALREFIHVDDLADACLFLMRHYEDDEIVNVGVGDDIAIRDLAMTIKDIVGFEGAIEFDHSKPDGMPRKLLDGSKLSAMGWRPLIELRQGIESTYEAYRHCHWANAGEGSRLEMAGVSHK